MGEKGPEGAATRAPSLGGRKVEELSRGESLDYLGTLLGWGKERVADTFQDYTKEQLTKAIEDYLAGVLTLEALRDKERDDRDDEQ